MTNPTETAGRPRRTVLLVDDNPSVLEVTGALLRHAGWHVIEAQDGIGALGVLRGMMQANGGHVPLVVTDLDMPRMDGYQLIEKLRANPQTATARILVLTASLPEEPRLQALGVKRYERKPVAASTFLQTLNDMSYSIA